MVYARRRRSTYRRKGRRGNRALSTRNIFNNKGARSQAAQISALKRKVNRVYRECKPEVKLVEGTPALLTLTRNQSSAAMMYTIELPDPGTGDNGRIGNVVNILNTTISMVMRIGFQGDVNYNVNGWAQTVNGCVRIVPFLLKSAGDYTPNISEILETNTYQYGDVKYDLNTVRPFEEGVSAKYKILGDYRYYLSFDDKNQINTKIHISGRKIRKYIQPSYATYGKSAIYLLITWNGVRPIEYQTETIATPAMYLSIMDKTAYTDP